MAEEIGLSPQEENQQESSQDNVQLEHEQPTASGSETEPQGESCAITKRWMKSVSITKVQMVQQGLSSSSTAETSLHVHALKEVNEEKTEDKEFRQHEKQGHMAEKERLQKQQAELQELKLKEEKLKVKEEKLEKEKDELKKEKDELKKEKDELKMKLALLELAGDKERVAEKERQLTGLQKQQAGLQKQQAGLQKQQAELQEQLKTIENQLAAIQIKQLDNMDNAMSSERPRFTEAPQLQQFPSSTAIGENIIQTLKSAELEQNLDASKFHHRFMGCGVAQVGFTDAVVEYLTKTMFSLQTGRTATCKTMCQLMTAMRDGSFFKYETNAQAIMTHMFCVLFTEHFPNCVLKCVNTSSTCILPERNTKPDISVVFKTGVEKDVYWNDVAFTIQLKSNLDDTGKIKEAYIQTHDDQFYNKKWKHNCSTAYGVICDVKTIEIFEFKQYHVKATGIIPFLSFRVDGKLQFGEGFAILCGMLLSTSTELLQCVAPSPFCISNSIVNKFPAESVKMFRKGSVSKATIYMIHDATGLKKCVVKYYTKYDLQFRNEVKTLNKLSEYEISNACQLPVTRIESVEESEVYNLLIVQPCAKYALQSACYSKSLFGSVVKSARSVLKVLHSMNVIHGDITPGNVLVMDDNTCIINDFGCSIDESTTLIEYIGTPCFASHKLSSLLLAPGHHKIKASFIFDYHGLFFTLLWFSVRANILEQNIHLDWMWDHTKDVKSQVATRDSLVRSNEFMYDMIDERVHSDVKEFMSNFYTLLFVSSDDPSRNDVDAFFEKAFTSSRLKEIFNCTPQQGMD